VNAGRASHLPSFGAEQLIREMDAAHVDRAVLVPPAWEGDRNDYALEAAAAWPDRFGVMGRVSVPDGETNRGRLADWRAQPGMLGVRVSFVRGPAPSWLTDGVADWLWEEAEAARVPVMVLAPGLLDKLGTIAARHPGLRLIVDHLGILPELRDAQIDPAIDALLPLAEYENVAVKATCLPSNVSDAYPFRSLHPRIKRVVEAFGPSRVFWGSDLTRLPCTYDEARRLFTDELDFVSTEDREWMMGRGIATWLDWPVAS
jgi:predicted TIM-barrel fold metal-dependent hydrolase